MLTDKMKLVLDWLIDKYKHVPGPLYINFPDICLAPVEHFEVEPILEYLHKEEYIRYKPYSDGGGYVSLTAKGLEYDAFQTKEQLPTQTNIFNGPVSNSAVGNSGTITINNGVSIPEALTFIQSQNISQSEKEEAKKVVTYIETLAENDAPLKKGTFSKFNDILSKYSWLLELTAKLVVTYLTTGSL